MSIRSLLCAVAMLSASSAHAMSESLPSFYPTARVPNPPAFKIYNPSPEENIPGFTYDPARATLAFDVKTKTLVVMLPARYEGTGLIRLTNGKPPVTHPDGEYLLYIPILYRASYIQVDSKKPGKDERLHVGVIMPDWDQAVAYRDYRVELLDPPAKKRWKYQAGMGISFLNYVQPGFDTLNETAITGKFSANRSFENTPWDFGGNFFYTLLPITATTSAARFLGINLRAGYRVPGISSPWQVRLSGGLYYTTFISTDYGFSNLVGPQFLPSVTRTLTALDMATAYVKLAPITGVAQGLGFSNHEFAVGTSWTHFLRADQIQSYTVSLDVTWLSTTIYGVPVALTSSTLGVSYGF